MLERPSGMASSTALHRSAAGLKVPHVVPRHLSDQTTSAGHPDAVPRPECSRVCGISTASSPQAPPWRIDVPKRPRTRSPLTSRSKIVCPRWSIRAATASRSRSASMLCTRHVAAVGMGLPINLQQQIGLGTLVIEDPAARAGVRAALVWCDADRVRRFRRRRAPVHCVDDRVAGKPGLEGLEAVSVGEPCGVERNHARIGTQVGAELGGEHGEVDVACRVLVLARSSALRPRLDG